MNLTIFQLVNPAVFAVFACGFAAIYYFDRRHAAPGLWAVSYALAGAGFMIDIFRAELPFAISSWASNALYTLSAVTFAQATFTHCREAVPWRLLVSLAVISAATFGWYRYITPDLAFRLLAINVGNAALFATCVPPLLRMGTTLRVERFLAFVLVVFSVQLIVRAIFTSFFLPLPANETEYASSVATLLFQITTGLSALVAAMMIFLMVGIRMASELRREADHDMLTGLLNRRGFEARAQQSLRSLERRGLPFSVVVCDIDHFKRVNDTHGHAAGDAVLVRLARLFGSKGRDSDLAARTGGEEFAIALWNTDATGARTFAESRRVAFAAEPTLPDATSCTASFGVAERRAGETLADALARADAALYTAKRAGRDRVVVATPRKPVAAFRSRQSISGTPLNASL